MAVESATYIDGLNSAYPPGTDPRSQGDDHLRLIKAVLKATFPSATDVWTKLSHTWEAAQTFSAGATLISTDAGAAAGPVLELYRDSATPAVNDLLGQLRFTGEDSAGNKETYAEIYSRIGDPTSTSEDAGLSFSVVTAGSLATELALTGAALYPATDQGLNLGASANRFNTAYVTTIELGHASDTTLSRSSAGFLAIEGGAGSLWAAQVFVGAAGDTWFSRYTAGELMINAGLGELWVNRVHVGSSGDTALSRVTTGQVAVNSVPLVRGIQADALAVTTLLPGYPGYGTPTWWPVGGLYHLILR